MRCNLKCIHCNVNSGPERTETLNLLTLKNILEKESFDSIVEVNITGGEPFLYKNLDNLLDLISSYFPKTKVSISTNGTCINTDILKKHRNKITSVNVSVDGMEAEHEIMRGKGTFNKAMKGVKTLIDLGVPVKINTVISNINYSSIKNFEKYFNIHYPEAEVRAIPLMPFGRAASDKQNFSHIELKSAEKLGRCATCTLPSTLSIYPDGSTYKCYAEFKSSHNA